MVARAGYHIPSKGKDSECGICGREGDTELVDGHHMCAICSEWDLSMRKAVIAECQTRYPTYSAIAGEWFDNGEAVVLQEGDVVSDWVTTEYAFTLLPEGLYWEKIQTTRPGAVTCYKAVRMGDLATFLNGESDNGPPWEEGHWEEENQKNMPSADEYLFGESGISNGACNLAMPIALVVFLVVVTSALGIPIHWNYVLHMFGL